MHEDVSFDPRVRAVEIQQVVVAAHENVIQEMHNRATPIAAREINRVVVTADPAEEVAREDAMTTAANSARAMNWFEARGGCREEAVTHHERCAIEIQVTAVRGAEGEMVEENFTGLHIDGVATVEFNMGIGNPGFRRTRRAIHRNASPGCAGTRRAREANILKRSALGQDASPVGDHQTRARIEVNADAGINCQCRTGSHRQGATHDIRRTRGCPRGVSRKTAGRGRPGHIVPNVDTGPRNFDTVGIERGHPNFVHAGQNGHAARGPARFPGRPRGGGVVHQHRTRANRVR